MTPQLDYQSMRNSTFTGTDAVRSALLLLGIWLIAPCAVAHLPEVFGYDYVRAGHTPAPDKSAPRQPRPAPEEAKPRQETSSLDPDAYLEQVSERERAGGPYASGLSEPLSILGLYHRDRGDYHSALNAYQRALHVARINDGLNSERQLPILLELIAIYKETGDYVALDGSYRYYRRIRGLGLPPFDKQAVNESLEYLQWEREAYGRRNDGKERRHLLEAILLNAQIIKHMADQPDIEFEWYRELVLSQMQNLYLLLGTDPVVLTQGGTIGIGGAPDEMADQRLAHMQGTALTRGRALLQDLIDRAQTGPVVELAALHLELGDWYQWNTQYRRANQEYAQVVELLQGAGESQLLSRWLDQPVELPHDRSLWQPPSEAAAEQPAITAKYKVSARGEASSIQISAPDEARSGAVGRLKRLLRDTHFRPRFSQGKAERSGTVTRRYQLLD